MTVPRTAPGLNAIAGPAAHTCDANDAGPGATWSQVSHGLQLQPLWRTLLQLTESIQIDARMTSYQSAVDYCAEQVMPLLHPY